MKKIFKYSVTAVAIPPKTIEVAVSSLDGVELAKGRVHIEDESVFNIAETLIHFPMEELEYGLYGDIFSQRMLEDIIKDVVEQATAQANYKGV